MSVTIMAAVWPLPLSTTDKIVLLALADAANDEGVTWIPLKSQRGKLDILTKTSLGERAIQGAIKRLTDVGHLARIERPGKGVIFTVYPTPAADAGRTSCAPQEKPKTPAADAGKPSVTVNTEASASLRGNAGKTKFPKDWALPTIDQLPPRAQACAAKWSAASYEAHGEAFACYWRGSGKMMKSWVDTWANRVVHIHSQVMRDEKHGNAPPAVANDRTPIMDPETKAASLERSADSMERMGRFGDATELRRSAADIRANL